MTITITNLRTGQKTNIVRDVSRAHPAWVHAQLGTRSESELQHYLDCCNVSDWYRDGRHLGDDTAGISMWEE